MVKIYVPTKNNQAIMTFSWNSYSFHFDYESLHIVVSTLLQGTLSLKFVIWFISNACICNYRSHACTITDLLMNILWCICLIDRKQLAHGFKCHALSSDTTAGSSYAMRLVSEQHEWYLTFLCVARWVMIMGCEAP